MIQLPPLPQALPKTQADWERVLNVMQQWMQSIQSHQWIAPTLLNGWVYYGSPYEPPGYYMDVAGRVHLRGLVKSGTVGESTPIFVLPGGYIPAHTSIFSVASNGAFGDIYVQGPADTTPGAVSLGTGSNVWASFDGISFDTMP